VGKEIVRSYEKNTKNGELLFMYTKPTDDIIMTISQTVVRFVLLNGRWRWRLAGKLDSIIDK